MDVTQFISFVIERGMVTNKFGLEIFFTAFKQASGDKYNHTTHNGFLDQQKFYYSMVLLSKVLFHSETDPFEAMF